MTPQWSLRVDPSLYYDKRKNLLARPVVRFVSYLHCLPDPTSSRDSGQ